MELQTKIKNLGALLVSAAAVLGASGSAQAVDLAKVNGRVITDAEVKGALSGLNEGQRANVLKDQSSRRQVLVSVIDQELLVQEGEKTKLDQDQEYKDALSNFRRQFLASRVLQTNLSSKLSDSSAKKYFESHKPRYSTDQVHAMHILVREEADARDVLGKTKGLSDDQFQALAEKVSKDPSAKNNRGDLGFFGRDRMVPEFSEAVFSAPEGAIVGPIKTTYGYHIVKVVKKRIGKVLQYDEVELRVKNDLRSELTQNFVGNLKKQAKLEIDEKAVEKF